MKNETPALTHYRKAWKLADATDAARDSDPQVVKAARRDFALELVAKQTELEAGVEAILRGGR